MSTVWNPFPVMSVVLFLSTVVLFALVPISSPPWFPDVPHLLCFPGSLMALIGPTCVVLYLNPVLLFVLCQRVLFVLRPLSVLRFSVSHDSSDKDVFEWAPPLSQPNKLIQPAEVCDQTRQSQSELCVDVKRGQSPAKVQPGLTLQCLESSPACCPVRPPGANRIWLSPPPCRLSNATTAAHGPPSYHIYEPLTHEHVY